MEGLLKPTAVGHGIGPDSPAWAATTDFLVDSPITVCPDMSLEDAREIMQRMRVHALIVTPRETFWPEQSVLGLVTSCDLGTAAYREKPRSQCTEFAALRVGDVMTGRDELPVVHYDSLLSLTVRDLHERFQGTGLTHLLVVELHEHGRVVARGLVSRAAVGRMVRNEPEFCS